MIMRIYLGEAVDVKSLARNIVRTGLADGATLVCGTGYWYNQGQLYEEVSHTLMVDTHYASDVRARALEYASNAGEKAISIEVFEGSLETFYT